ncbi:MAG: hypothetical protein AAF617_08410 [Bacteroidota bacterium]
MKKRKFQKQLIIKKVSISNLVSITGGGTHYRWCPTEESNWTCENEENQ